MVKLNLPTISPETKAKRDFLDLQINMQERYRSRVLADLTVMREDYQPPLISKEAANREYAAADTIVQLLKLMKTRDLSVQQVMWMVNRQPVPSAFVAGTNRLKEEM